MISWLAVLLLFAASPDDLFDAARKGDVAAVTAALDAGVPVDSVWRYDQTALFIASFRGHADVVKLLLERGASPDARDSFYKMRALEAGMKDPQIVAMLVAKGAQGGDAALTFAAGTGRKPMLQELLAKAKWTQPLLDQALFAAEVKKQADTAALLRAAGAKPIAKADVDAAALATVAGFYQAEGFPGPVKVEAADGLVVLIGLGPERREYRVIDADHFVFVLDPVGEKLVVEREAEKVKSLEFVTERMKLRFVPQEASK